MCSTKEFLCVVFDDWWKCNKDDHCIFQEYYSYKETCESLEVEPLSYDQWGFEYWIDFTG